MQKPTTEAPVAATDWLRIFLLMFAALTLFSCLDASAKYLAANTAIPVAELVWVRFAGQTVGMIALVGLLNLPSLFITRRLGLQLLRSLLMAATTAFNFLALEELRLDQTITIVFLAPLVVALLAGPLLGEWVGWRRLVAIFTGFVGVLVAVHPSGEGLSLAVGYAFAAMLAYALFMLMTRHLVAYDPPMVTLFYAMLVGAVFGAPPAFAEWVWPDKTLEWILLLSLGVFGGVGHYFFIHAYTLGPASRVSPVLYIQILTMVAFGYLVFGDLPDIWTLSGALIIVASGIYLYHRERVIRRQD